jgi:hypothetical protein
MTRVSPDKLSGDTHLAGPGMGGWAGQPCTLASQTGSVALSHAGGC